MIDVEQNPYNLVKSSIWVKNFQKCQFLATFELGKCVHQPVYYSKKVCNTCKFHKFAIVESGILREDNMTDIVVESL